MKKKNILRWALAGTCLIGLAAILYLLSPRLFFKVITIGGLLLCALSIIKPRSAAQNHLSIDYVILSEPGRFDMYTTPRPLNIGSLMPSLK